MNDSKIVTRFAPSPTGYLHIGGARTALFNYLFAKRQGGKFLLRIEDTDRVRSTEASIEAIFKGMDWLGLKQDGDVVFQFANREKHAALAQRLLEAGKAYYCYASPEELTEMRKNGQGYDRRWRDKTDSDAPKAIKPVIRLKAPLTGSLTLNDLVQGEVTMQADQLDDFILLRADGTPTYMLSVVADDHEMGVTHIIRGDDHFNNYFRQAVLYDALGFDLPKFAHIPLIHGEDGAKLSKRHGALGIFSYAEMGYLPEAMANYLLRLGWSHGNDEIISAEQAVEWFNLEAIGRGPARFDFKKLDSINAHYVKSMQAEKLLDCLIPYLGEVEDKMLLLKALPHFTSREHLLPKLAASLKFLIKMPKMQADAQAILDKMTQEQKIHLRTLTMQLKSLEHWTKENFEPLIKNYIKENALKFLVIGQPIRIALSGTNNAPGIMLLLELLGRDISIARMEMFK